MVQLKECPQQLAHSQKEKQFQGNGKVALAVKNNGKAAKLKTSVPYQIVHAVAGRIRFRIPRIYHDRHYAQRLRTLLESEASVTNVRLNRDAQCVIIGYKTGIKAREMPARFACSIQLASQNALATRTLATSAQPARSNESSTPSGLKLPLLATLLSLLSGPFGLSIPPVAIGITVALAALPVAQRAWKGICTEHRLNVDFLDLSALTIASLQGSFLASSSMLALIELGETIRDKTARSSQQQTQSLLSSLAQLVWVERNGEKQQIPLEEVRLEDTVIVYPGEQIPIDGRIIQGKALIDEQKLTGESMPVVREKGDPVYASTLVREGCLYILTQRIGAQTRAGRTIQLIQNAPIHDTRIENYAAKIANRAVLPTLLLGGAVFAATRNSARAASVLTLDFATGIRVSVPTTVLAALTYAARRGILIRSGRALEQLAQVDTLVFDKTGTLTLGEVSLVNIQTLNSLSPRKMLQLAAAAEQRITHPVAEAVTRHAQTQNIAILPRGKWKYHVGLGIRANIEGQEVVVGSERFLVQEGISLKKLKKCEGNCLKSGLATLYLASDGELQGILQYHDPLRPESREVIRTLRTTIGAEVHLLTGDRQQRAREIATELDIPSSQTHAEAFPEHKAEIVQRLHNEGKTVAFIGDGINDSAALAYADVSVSFRDGSDIARETADVVLMNNNLRDLVTAIAIARQAKQIVHQNTGLVAVPNLSGLVLAATVGLNPMTATMINNGSSVIAGLNGLRPVLNGHTHVEAASVFQQQ